jgi:hypothetical protein
MSLHKFADMVAKQGRGEDSLLIHMTPDEVNRLQEFAQANGRSLTINPTTGLPEAGMLSDLFKAVAPIALGAFLGPAGMGITFGGLSSAASAGLLTGGITSLATGSLSRGLMAGLGAYGGAGLGANLMGAGTASIGSAAEGIQGPIGSSESGFSASQAISAAPKADILSAGFDVAKADPMAFAKQNASNLGYAAAPIFAGAMSPTVTKMPTPTDNRYIRQMAFNLNPDTGKPDPLYGLREMTPVKAADWGDKTFQGQRDLFYKQNQNQNQNPYELGVGSLNQPSQQQQQPTPMAGGGIVALAGGGDAALEAYQAGNYGEASRLLADAGMNAQDVVSKYGLSQADAATVAQNLGYKGDMSGVQYAAPPAPTYTQYTPEQMGSYLTTNPSVDLATAIKATNADPNAVNQYIASLDNPFRGSTETERGSGTLGIYNQMKAQGIDPNELYAASLATDPKYAGWTKDMIQQGYNLDKGMYALSDAKKGNVSDTDWAKLMVGNGTWDKPQYDPNAMAQATGLSIAEVRARYELEKLKANPTIKTIDNTKYTSGTGVIPGGNYGNATNPGDITTNADGTVTVHPNIPGRPDGGFTGMGQVRDTYTAGGGSLGYTAKAPKTIEEFNQMFNKQTGDSLAAYDYLMGKGANNNAYPVKSGVSKVAVPYNEFVLGKKTTRPATTTTKTTTVQGTPGQPQTFFNEAEYLAANPDVAAEIKSGKTATGQPSKLTSAYDHWLMYGKAEGRKFAGDYEGYLTAAALANSAGATGGGSGNTTGAVANSANTVSDSNTANSITGLAAPANNSISVSDAVASPADGNDGVGVGDFAKGGVLPPFFSKTTGKFNHHPPQVYADGGYAMGGGLGSLGGFSDGGRLLKGPGDGVSDSIPATIGAKGQPARLADGEFVVPARIVSELGNGSTDAGAKKLYAMMDRVQKARGKTTGKNKVAANSRSDKYLPA